MSSGVSVRPFRAHEWRVYRDLRLRALADSPDAFATKLEDSERSPDSLWASRHVASTDSPSEISLVAEIDDRAVGMAYGRYEVDDRDRAHLYAMWVDPPARRMGAGRQLVEAVVSWVRAAGVRQLILEVTEGNEAGARLYQRAGFVLTKEFSPLRPDSTLRVQTMRLDL